MSYQTILLLSGLVLGISNVLSKELSKKGFKSHVYTSASNLMSAIISLPFIFYQFYISRSPYIWLLIIISVIIYGFSTTFSFKAYKRIDASTVSIIHKLSVVVAALIGIFFLNEVYTTKKYFGLFLIFISSVVILYEGKKITFNKGIIFALFMAFTSAIAGVLDKLILKDFSSFTYIFINNLLVFTFFTLSKNTVKDSMRLIKTHGNLVFLNSIVKVIPWAAFIWVLQKTDVSQTIPAYKSLSLISPVILGILFLKETNRLSQKILGTIIGVLGIILLY